MEKRGVGGEAHPSKIQNFEVLTQITHIGRVSQLISLVAPFETG